MTSRELKRLAKRIAELEKIIQKNENQEKVKKAQRKINSLCSQIKDENDMWYLDEQIQQILEEENI